MRNIHNMMRQRSKARMKRRKIPTLGSKSVGIRKSVVKNYEV